MRLVVEGEPRLPRSLLGLRSSSSADACRFIVDGKHGSNAIPVHMHVRRKPPDAHATAEVHTVCGVENLIESTV